MSEPLRVFTHCLSLPRRLETALRLSSGLRACRELDLLTLLQPVPSLQGERHDTGFPLNKPARRALSVQTIKRPGGVVPFKEIPLVPSLTGIEPKR